MVRNRPRWAERSSRSSAASSTRAVPSGSSTSRRCSPALRSSLAFNEAAWSSSIRSASSRSPGWQGSRSITATMTSACSGDTSPDWRASSVVRRSPHRGRAVRSIREPWPCRPPAVWVSQSPGETQPSVLAASVASTSTATVACNAASEERNRLDLHVDVQQLLRPRRRPQRSPTATRPAPARTRAQPAGWSVSPGASPCAHSTRRHRQFSICSDPCDKVIPGGWGCPVGGAARCLGSPSCSCGLPPFRRSPDLPAGR